MTSEERLRAALHRMWIAEGDDRIYAVIEAVQEISNQLGAVDGAVRNHLANVE